MTFFREKFKCVNSVKKQDRGFVVAAGGGQRLRITPYGDKIVRVQAARSGEEFLADDYFETVMSHDWGGALELNEYDWELHLETAHYRLAVDKKYFGLRFHTLDHKQVLKCSDLSWSGGGKPRLGLRRRSKEHFIGLGHPVKGQLEKLDLRDQRLTLKYDSQAPLLVPFFMSSLGYGMFVNSTWPTTFDFSKKAFVEQQGGQLDVFLFLGDFAEVLDLYTQLTGRPQLPPVGFFGLAMSDKERYQASDDGWWREKIKQMGSGDYHFDHVVIDNRWRGKRKAKGDFSWKDEFFPDPVAFQKFLKENGLICSIDFHQFQCELSEGWLKEMSIGGSTNWPDFYDAKVREWFWRVIFENAFDTNLDFPSDGIWVDEFDRFEGSRAKLSNGRSWRENENGYFFQLAKAICEGWKRDMRGKRPFIWMRGASAGGQRYATLWSGDIYPTWDVMKEQVRAMQSAGASGFPFLGHDAGGYKKPGPTDAMYRNWSLAMGAFSPMWKPHGYNLRFPWLYSEAAQEDARKYCDLRMRLMPYLYSFAHLSRLTGMPIVRALPLEYPEEREAWNHELQYMWGSEILVAPNCGEGEKVDVWLPPGNWFDFWTDQPLAGASRDPACCR